MPTVLLLLSGAVVKRSRCNLAVTPSVLLRSTRSQSLLGALDQEHTMAKAALFSGLRGLVWDLYKFAGCHSRAHDTPDESPEDVYGVCDEPRDGLWAPKPLGLCNTGCSVHLTQLGFRFETSRSDSASPKPKSQPQHRSEPTKPPHKGLTSRGYPEPKTRPNEARSRPQGLLLYSISLMKHRRARSRPNERRVWVVVRGK